MAVKHVLISALWKQFCILFRSIELSVLILLREQKKTFSIQRLKIRLKWSKNKIESKKSKVKNFFSSISFIEYEFHSTCLFFLNLFVLLNWIVSLRNKMWKIHSIFFVHSKRNSCILYNCANWKASQMDLFVLHSIA